AQSLRCYTCKEPTDIAKCRTATLCPPKATCFSMPTVYTFLYHIFLSLILLPLFNLPVSGYPFFGNITVTRDCEEECLAFNGIGANKPKSCCYTDLC
ncbi:LYPD2 protein, partial [Trogon melanurus]|nr:LYPD2 protein [Trogon melanurus]